MAGNSYGTLFKITTFGESHGEALGGIIDGCPAGIELDFEAIQKEMQRPTVIYMAEKLNTIPYEILTSISQRVKRMFYRE